MHNDDFEADRGSAASFEGDRSSVLLPDRPVGLSATPQHPIIVFVLKAQTVTQIRSREFANTIGFLCSRPCRKSSSTR